jgi:hypothetical protein
MNTDFCCTSLRRLDQPPREVARTVHQAPGFDVIRLGVVKQQQFVEWTCNLQGTETMQLRVFKVSLLAEVWLPGNGK